MLHEKSLSSYSAEPDATRKRSAKYYSATYLAENSHSNSWSRGVASAGPRGEFSSGGGDPPLALTVSFCSGVSHRLNAIGVVVPPDQGGPVLPIFIEIRHGGDVAVAGDHVGNYRPVPACRA